MPVNSKDVLVGPINAGEAYAYMDVPRYSGGYDVGYLASNVHGKTNKWAKNKFIRYDKYSTLSDLERVGTINDRANGIFYGLKMGNVGGRIETMHECTFEYLSPRPWTDPCRWPDLNGYDRNAKPNPMGTLPEVIHLDVNYQYGTVEIIYDEYNTTGVNLSDVIASMTTSGADFKNFYPCVLVTLDNKKYVRALWNMHYDLLNLDNNDRKYQGYTTFYHNNTWARQWALLCGGLPGAAEGKSMTVTVFFQRSIDVGNGGVAGDPDFREWRQVDSLIVMNTGYACPEAVAKTIQLRNLITKGLDITGGVWRTSSTLGNIVISLNSAWADPAENATYTLDGTFYDSNNEPVGSISGSYSYYPGLMILMSFDVRCSLLLIPQSAVFTLRWSVTSSLSPSRPCNSGVTSLSYGGSTIRP
ncbi:MAG: hypothetical protein OSJ25_06930 [Paramuribaculum sp.]|uniref:hypothetical protein n=1 Tax=Muribaculum intestinale TaxID=1796646 RepID=UPI0025B76E22|nr:hypothetical protein [Muribaculum intestinale]MCX4333166.1 hypothetical protein [Paramuribaculum sp.]